MNRRLSTDPTTALLSLLLLASTAGCATRGYVRTEVAAANARIDSVEGQVEENQDRLAEQDQRLERQGEELERVGGTAEGASKTAQEALERAIEAGELAEGKLLFETVLSEDRVRFGFDRAELTDEAKAALAEFVEQLKAQGGNAYVEIQGHTDSVGAEAYNLELGEARAEAVRRELSAQGLPLHRLAVISYGETAPVADNGTREGRARNRRVVLVVLR